MTVRTELSYCCEQLRIASRAITAGPDRDLKGRLYEAVVLGLSSLRAEDFDDANALADFEWILKALTQFPPENETEQMLEATLRRTGAAEDELIAARIVALAARCDRLSEANQTRLENRLCPRCDERTVHTVEEVIADDARVTSEQLTCMVCHFTHGAAPH